jgi:catechol 2,3-dioxygenase-like lactoylglutathione lyase family enzyme
MLSTYSAMPTLGVKDLAAARSFYGDTLGFSVARDDEEGVRYRHGSGEILVYQSAYAGTNKATAVSFEIPANKFDAEIRTLRDKGIEFQTFDMDGVEWSDGVATISGMRGVWFADPSGNLISVATPMG